MFLLSPVVAEVLVMQDLVRVVVALPGHQSIKYLLELVIQYRLVRVVDMHRMVEIHLLMIFLHQLVGVEAVEVAELTELRRKPVALVVAEFIGQIVEMDMLES
jgi:hypothetical protein